jgi:XTP/dITP diphosphohydrolase
MTRRLLPNSRLLIASHNPGKVAEIAELVAPFGLLVTTAGELGLPEPAETGSSFVANAELKAVAGACRRLRARGGGLGWCARHLFGALGRTR